MLHLHRRVLSRSIALAAAICLTGCGMEDSSALEDRIQEITILTGEQTTSAEETTTTLAATTSAAATTVTTTEETTTVTTATTAATTAVTTTAATTGTAAYTIGELPVVSTTTGAAAADPSPDAYGLTAEDYAFLHDTVFVGDSICSGLRVYGILPNDNVVAKGCVGARNIFEYTFDCRGNEFGVAYVLTVLKPRYIVFSMGMNDVNMTTPEVYCKNYDFLLKTIRSVMPDSVFFVASVTPITADTTFSTNEKIDTLNQTIREHLYGTSTGFVDVASGLKTWNGALNPKYNGGDGVHLAPEAYYVYLNQICDQLVDTKTVGGYANGIAYGWAKK